MHLPPPGKPITLPGPGEARWLIWDNTDPPAEIWDTAGKLLPLLPAWAREGDLAIRDALLRAWGRMADLFWASAGRMLRAQSSPRFASGVWLTWHGQRRKLPKAPGESESEYRARLLTRLERIAPTPIRTSLRAILAPRFAPKLIPVFVEPLRDFAFWRSTSAAASAPRSFWQSRASGSPRHWASGRLTGLRTAGAYWVSAGTKTTQDPTGTRSRPALWVLLPATLSSKRGGWGNGTNQTARGAFWGSHANGTRHTVWTSAATARLVSQVVKDLAARVGAGVVRVVRVDPHLINSVTR